MPEEDEKARHPVVRDKTGKEVIGRQAAIDLLNQRIVDEHIDRPLFNDNRFAYLIRRYRREMVAENTGKNHVFWVDFLRTMPLEYKHLGGMGKGTEWSEETKGRARLLRAGGHSYVQIAQALSLPDRRLTRQVVRSWCLDIGVPKRSQGGHA